MMMFEPTKAVNVKDILYVPINLIGCYITESPQGKYVIIHAVENFSNISFQTSSKYIVAFIEKVIRNIEKPELNKIYQFKEPISFKIIEKTSVETGHKYYDWTQN
jgi:hypothetical protein